MTEDRTADPAPSESPPLLGLLSDEQAPQVAQSMGLLASEYTVLRAALGRPPTGSELAVFSGMWSEHCSYKSSRHLLATLPKEGARVLAGPGSHAGVVDVGEGWAVAFKIESHNHPSAIEPYHGAATGVGGILRDVIAQGARPCALLDFLCFGDPRHRDTRRIERGVVAGIAGYGNAIGVANVGGRTHYDIAYQDKPLVNALAAGLLRHEQGRSARTSEREGIFLLVGARTGRDGVLGAAFASQALGGAEKHSAQRTHIQVGDPFAGKLLLEAVLAFGPEQGLLAVQDLGACGIACAAFEMAALSDVGLDIDLDAVPLREPDLAALEILLSESQERFALLIRPDCLASAGAHFQSYGLTAAALGSLTASGQVRVFHRGQCCVDLPAKLVAGGAPQSKWPLSAAWRQTAVIHRQPATLRGAAIGEALLSLLPLAPDLEPLYSHFDQTVGNRTVCGPGQAAAAVLRLPESQRGFALTLTGRGDLCTAHPYLGAQSGLAEALRRLACVGAELVAITDGLNFASPRDPVEHLGMVEVIRGLADGLRALGVPVTGGNVSLYNQSPTGPIPPTPMIGGLGLVGDVSLVPRSPLGPGQRLWLLGVLRDEPGASLYTRLRCGGVSGLPQVDLPAEQRLARLLLAVVAAQGCVRLIPVSRGGILLAVAKLCRRAGLGARLQLPDSPRPDQQLLGEHPAQVLAIVEPAAEARLAELAQQHRVPALAIGALGGLSLHIVDHCELGLCELAAAQKSPAALGMHDAA